MSNSMLENQAVDMHSGGIVRLVTNLSYSTAAVNATCGLDWIWPQH